MTRQTNTAKETKNKIKHLRYLLCKDVSTIETELKVTHRTVIMALREESKEQYLTRYYMQRLKNQKDKIRKLFESIDLDNITTMQLHYFIEKLPSELDELSSREMDVFGEVLS